ncbi:hypothetical protein BGW38_009296 [Lunasporangiospora selenospora]|uniref:Protein farnesyltransferase subunit beta n=1 Tax=Lunasporangiospora selenospora TaxID=979761 RepID=A0A9P6FX62_9FUNG|nr:hypothetical protein BGW38_009296 [Lunasporangiospora selenospora]
MGVILRDNEEMQLCEYKDDDFPTDSSILQILTEGEVRTEFLRYTEDSPIQLPLASAELRKIHHVDFSRRALNYLSSKCEPLDSSRPWLCYWILHSLDLLDYDIPQVFANRAVDTLSRMQSPTGGFAGGPGQMPHLANTYAAVNALTIIGTPEAYSIIDRPKLLDFLLHVKQPDGSFTMHEGGETDVRGTYCALAVATITNILTPELTEGVAEFVARCQTYQGGIGGYPGVEAHGGYAFCGLAALEILNRIDLLDMETFIKWSAMRQMSIEGGFQGRTNKLVDGCYSFWMGGVFPIIAKHLGSTSKGAEDLEYAFDQTAIQEYMVVACQGKNGGLRDKPSKSPDYYHTCYGLSGISLSQHHISFRHDLKDIAPNGLSSLLWYKVAGKECVAGSSRNLIAATHPILNVRMEKAKQAILHFYGEAAEKVVQRLETPQ